MSDPAVDELGPVAYVVVESPADQGPTSDTGARNAIFSISPRTRMGSHAVDK